MRPLARLTLRCHPLCVCSRLFSRKTTVECLRTFQGTGVHSDFLQCSLEFTMSLRIEFHFGPA